EFVKQAEAILVTKKGFQPKEMEGEILEKILKVGGPGVAALFSSVPRDTELYKPGEDYALDLDVLESLGLVEINSYQFWGNIFACLRADVTLVGERLLFLAGRDAPSPKIV